MRAYLFICFICLLISSSCTEEFEAAVGGDNKLLVVDALVTNAEGPYYVSLKYTAPNITAFVSEVSNASVTIVDQDEIEYSLNHTGEGIYETPPSFRGMIGNSYRLKIKNSSKLYESDICFLREPSCIDKLAFKPSTVISNNQEKKVLEFNVDASVCSDEETYLRWDVKEDWKIALRMPCFYVMVTDSTWEQKENMDYYCFKNDERNTIAIHSFLNQGQKQIVGKKVFSTSTYSSDRFTTRYRATINQYSISKEEYGFWSRLKETSETENDFFGKQPYGLIGNIHCLTDPSEKVLGFFQVAGVSEKQIYVTPFDIAKYYLGTYSPEKCATDTIPVSEEYNIFDKYNEIVDRGNWEFFMPLTTPTGEITDLVFTEPRCALCNKSNARSSAPIDWIDE